MKRKGIILIVSALIVGSISCAYIIGAGDKVLFSHKTHASVDCLTCHEGVQGSEEAVGRHYPDMPKCAGCHDKEFMEKCENCHTNSKKAVKLRRTQTDVIFSHKSHIPRVSDEGCLKCHKNIVKATTVDQSILAEMESCTPCHSARWHELQCSSCHRRLGTRKLIEVVEFSHKGTWDISCKEFARRGVDMNLCSQCHEELFCANCHSKREELPPAIKYPEMVERDFIHRGDYIQRHALELEVDQTLCYSCHGVSFCNNCHAKRNLSPASGRAPIKPVSHTGDWAINHGDDARRNLTACASCHRNNEEKCVGCHKPGGVGPTPHPKDWDSTLSKDKDRVCKNCHTK